MHLLDPAPFGRILPAMVTPMKADGAVDFEAAQQLARQLVADGADGLVVNGTTGESPTTHMEEKGELVQAVKEGVFRHYKAVNDSADKPIIVYDVPGRTGLHIQLETYRRMAELDHVKAVKDATGDIAGAVRKRMETGLTWYSGDDGLFLPFLSVGAVGIISVIAHAAAGPMRDLANAFDRGDIHEAQRISVQLAPLVEAMNGNGFQAVMAKASLKVRGILDSTEMRLPNVGPGEAELVRAEKGMRAAGLL